jgi:hypothetical protein
MNAKGSGEAIPQNITINPNKHMYMQTGLPKNVQNQAHIYGGFLRIRLLLKNWGRATM